MRRGASERERSFAAAVGRELRRCRKERGMTQQELSEATGTNRVNYANWELGLHAIPLYPLLRAAAVLQVTLADLVGPAVGKSTERV
jgi:transcriptional regulator with XRE-family HTH domain